MSLSLLSHALEKEFPALNGKIAQLKKDNPRFVSMLAEHDDLDGRITRDEAGEQRLDDAALTQLKMRRLQLKDELYKLACS
jgi:uncharacterized protein YdcH (DUF465 family)